jgi:hypothetical protein
MTTRTVSARNVAPLPTLVQGDHHRHVQLANQLAAAANAGYLALPDPLVDAIREAATIDAALSVAELEASKVEHVAAVGRDEALAAASAAGKAGQDPGAIEAPLVDAAAALPRLRLRIELLRQARSTADGELGATIGANAGRIFDVLARALADTLKAAEPDAPVVLAGLRIWTDPAAVHRAPQDVQQAFGRLAGLTARHDAVRGAAVAAFHTFSVRGWESTQADRIRDFGRAIPSNASPAEARDADAAGGGVVMRLSESTDLLVTVAYRPEGHPVQRLALAAAAAVPV